MAIFTVVSLLMDNILRPILIKRGADLPLLLILLGVIGGLLAFGLLGLFLGPVILAVTYTLLQHWVDEDGLRRLPASHVFPTCVGSFRLHEGLGLAEAGAIEAGGGGAGWGRAPPPVKNPDPLLRGDGRAHLPGVGGTEKRAEKHKRREADVTLVMPQQPLTRHDNMVPSR